MEEYVKIEDLENGMVVITVDNDCGFVVKSHGRRSIIRYFDGGFDFLDVVLSCKNIVEVYKAKSETSLFAVRSFKSFKDGATVPDAFKKVFEIEPPKKEMSISDIEKELGYKIKLVD